MVSHRVSALKNCDKIIFIENKKKVDEGKYEYLEKNNIKFRELIKEQNKNLNN